MASSCRTSAHHRHVVDLFRIELGRDAQAGAGFGVRRPLEQRPVRTDHQRRLLGEHAKALNYGAAIRVVSRVEHCIGIAIAPEEALQPDEIGRRRIADENRADPSVLNETDPAQDECAHDDLAHLGGADHEGANMRRVERQRDAAFSTRAAGGERLPPGDLAYLARELSNAMACDCGLAIETVTTRDIDRTFEHDPNRGVALARFEEDLSGREFPYRAACEALGRVDLAGVEHGKQLMTTGLEHAHRAPSGNYPQALSVSW